jgi:hypothetical protein
MSNEQTLNVLKLKQIYKKMEEHKIPPLLISKGKNKGKLHTNKKKTISYCLEYCEKNNIILYENTQEELKSEYGECARINGLNYEKMIAICIRSISQFTRFCGDIKTNTDPNSIVDIWRCFNQLTECYTGTDLDIDEYKIKDVIVSIIQLTKYIGNITSDTKVELLSNKKVESIYNKKTTSKADIIITNNDIDYPISVKMSNKGTQLHVSPFENMKMYCKKNNIYMEPNVEKVFNRFLGITKPTEDELKRLNMTRNTKR